MAPMAALGYVAALQSRASLKPPSASSELLRDATSLERSAVQWHTLLLFGVSGLLLIFALSPRRIDFPARGYSAARNWSLGTRIMNANVSPIPRLLSGHPNTIVSLEGYVGDRNKVIITARCVAVTSGVVPLHELGVSIQP